MDYKYFFLILICFFLTRCDKGLSPEDTSLSSEVSGTVYFRNWPPADSLYDIRLILFQDYPPINIIDEIFYGRAVVFPGLNDNFRVPFFVDSFQFRFAVPPNIYAFFAVGQQYGPTVTADWRIVGQYDVNPQDTLPSPLTIAAGQLLENIWIHVNFDSLP